MYRRTVNLIVPKVINKLSTSTSHRLVGSLQFKNTTAGVPSRSLPVCFCPTSLHNNSYYHSRSNKRKSLGNNNLVFHVPIQTQANLLSRRFFSSSKDAKLRQDDELTEEEIKVLDELEREEARFKEEQDKQLSELSEEKDSTSTTRLRQSVSQEFVPFENQQRIIQDVIEQVWNPMPEPEKVEYEPPEEFLQRGKTGVFDLGELVDLLGEENANEIVAISLPKEIDYADHMLIVTARNPRHLMALATYVRKRYKMKTLKGTDVIPKIISEDFSQGWIALDLGNIILHIFMQKQRDLYDLEVLWTVGPLFDDLYNAKDPEIIQMLNLMK